MGDEDGVESGGEGGINIGLGTVADHPGLGGIAGVVAGDGEVGFAVLFGEDFYGREVGRETGAAEFVGLLGVVSLGDEDEAVTG